MTIVKYFSFEVLKKKLFPIFKELYFCLTKKIVKKLYKIWFLDPGSGIRDQGSGKNQFRIPDPGVKKAPDPESGSATLAKNCTGSGPLYISFHKCCFLPIIYFQRLFASVLLHRNIVFFSQAMSGVSLALLGASSNRRRRCWLPHFGPTTPRCSPA